MSTVDVITVGEKPARYTGVNLAWPDPIPPCSRIEAERAAKRLWRKFAPERARERVPRVRRVWINPRASSRAGHPNGWWRLAHDISHKVFWRTYLGTRRPHDPLHEHYEKQIVDFVLASGWLDGKLKPPAKAKPTRDEKREREVLRVEAAIKRWTSKRRRAETALRKLARRQRALAKQA